MFSALPDSALDVINALQQLGCSFMAAALNQTLRNCGDHLADALLPVVHGNVDCALPHLHFMRCLCRKAWHHGGKKNAKWKGGGEWGLTGR